MLVGNNPPVEPPGMINGPRIVESPLDTGSGLDDTAAVGVTTVSGALPVGATGESPVGCTIDDGIAPVELSAGEAGLSLAGDCTVEDVGWTMISGADPVEPTSAGVDETSSSISDSGVEDEVGWTMISGADPVEPTLAGVDDTSSSISDSGVEDGVGRITGSGIPPVPTLDDGVTLPVSDSATEDGVG